MQKHLHRLALSWIEKSLPILETNKDKIIASPHSYEWYKDTNDPRGQNYKRFTHTFFWPLEILEEVRALHEYSVFLEQLRKSKQVTDREGKYVGTKLSHALLNLDIFLEQLLPAAAHYMGLVDYEPDEQLEATFHYIFEHALPYISEAPLYRFSLVNQQEIKLDDFCSILPMDETSITEALRARALENGLGPEDTFFLEQPIMYSFRVTVPQPIVTFADANQEPDIKLHATINDQCALLRTKLLWTFTLNKLNNIQIFGTHNYQVLLDGSLGQNGSTLQLGFPSGKFNKITDKDIEKIKNTWNLLSDDNLKKRRALIVALSRIDESNRRGSQNDRLIDLCISAESTFLTDKEELSYKLALRVCNWIQYKNWSKQQLFNFMKKAYSLRSDIVHGTTQLTSVPIKVQAHSESYLSVLFNDHLTNILTDSILKLLHEDDDQFTKKGEYLYWDRVVIAE